MSGTILLADDSLTIQKVVELTFADTDYEVVALSSGDDLLQRLPDARPDLVICDIIMPGKDGYEVCQEIKSDPATLHIPVILLSGTFEPFDRDRALAAGCSEIMTKPFEARKLVDTVERLLSGGAAEAAALSDAGAVEPPIDEEMGAAVDEATPEVPPPVAEPEMAADIAPELPPQPADTGPSLDFTDTGFAEMEAAAVAADQPPSELPEEGLEFEFSDEFDSFGEPEADDESEATDTAPDVEISEEVAAVTPPAEVESEPPQEPEMPPVPEPVTADEPEGGPFPEETTDHGVSAPVSEAPDPFTTEEEADVSGDPAFDRSPTETIAIDAADLTPQLATSPGDVPIPEDQVSVEMPPPEPEVPVEAAPAEPEVAAVTPPPDFTPPPEVAPPEIEIPEPPAVEEPEFEPGESEPPETGTDQAEPPMDSEPPPPVVDAAAPTAASIDEQLITAGLSDEDVERIARRVMELCVDRIETIAWEVVPDMAEVVVRQRIRELEADTEASTPTSQPD
jgi:CheY-like chemotaxis protein